MSNDKNRKNQSTVATVATDAPLASVVVAADAPLASVAPVPTAPEPSPRERKLAEIGEVSKALATAIAAEDDVEIARLSARRASLKGEVVRMEANERVTSALPAIVAALAAATLDLPSHRFEAKLIFEGGKCIGYAKIDIDAKGMPAAVSQGQVRANLNVAKAIDPRVPPVGFHTSKSSHGIVWDVEITAPGVATATSVGQTSVTGSLGSVGRAITRQPTCDPYACFGLGAHGQSFDAARDTRWTLKG